MAPLKTMLYLGTCLCVWIITNADMAIPPAENVHWTSLDFKTVLRWTTRESNHNYIVRYSKDNGEWQDVRDCSGVSHPECDLTQMLQASDSGFIADIITEPEDSGYGFDPDDVPHINSPPFNPYIQSNISAVTFSVEATDESTVLVTVTDPVSAIYQGGRQLTIRDIFKTDLKYRISYIKFQNTREKHVISDSSVMTVTGLDAGYTYCFMVAACIQSRPKSSQRGLRSEQLCTELGHTGLEVGSWVGIMFVCLTALIISITVTVLCCRRHRASTQHPAQTSAPV